MSDPSVAVALTQGIAEALTGVEPGMIRIVDVASLRRLLAVPERLLSAAGSVKVDYRIVFPTAEIAATDFNATSVTSHEGEMLVAISSALDSRTSLEISLHNVTASEPLVFIGSSAAAFNANATNMTEGAANDTFNTSGVLPQAWVVVDDDNTGAAAGGVIAGLLGVIMAMAVVVFVLARYTVLFSVLNTKVREFVAHYKDGSRDCLACAPVESETADPELGEADGDMAADEASEALEEVHISSPTHQEELQSPMMADDYGDDMLHIEGIPHQRSVASAETWDVDAAAADAVEAAEAANQMQVEGELDDVPEQPGASPLVSQGFKGRSHVEEEMLKDDAAPVIPSSMSSASMATWKSLFECVKEEEDTAPQDHVPPTLAPTIMGSLRSQKPMHSSTGPASVILEL